MMVRLTDLLTAARCGRYAVGAFNVYTLEGAVAVVNAAEKLQSPTILQVLPTAIAIGGLPLVAMCLDAAKRATVPMTVQLDHCSDKALIRDTLDAGIGSVMADGSHLPFKENMAFTGAMAKAAHSRGRGIEAELGRLSGSEDGQTVSDREACLTDPDLAVDFVSRTGVDALAVCVGNVHGRYVGDPNLDFHRLANLSERVPVPLVMHGTSGLPDTQVQAAIAAGTTKFNVNTEVRAAGLMATRDCVCRSPLPELVEVMESAIGAMAKAAGARMHAFGSVGKG